MQTESTINQLLNELNYQARELEQKYNRLKAIEQQRLQPSQASELIKLGVTMAIVDSKIHTLEFVLGESEGVLQ